MDINARKFLNNKEVNFSHSDQIKIIALLKEYALEIASDAYNEGFTYAIHSHENFTQIGLNRAKYLQKLKNEL